MKIKYVFCNEEIDVDVSDEWGRILADLDKEESDNERRETRRHCSLSLFNADDPHFISDVDVPSQAMLNIAVEQLQDAVKMLSPRDRYLLDQVYLKNRAITDIALETEKRESTIRDSTRRAIKHLRYNFLKK